MPAVAVTDATVDAAVLQAHGPVIVDFWAPWCAPCKQISPLIDRLADDDGRATYVKINADENPVATATYRVTSLPTIAMFLDGELVNVMGAKPKPLLLRILNGWLG